MKCQHNLGLPCGLQRRQSRHFDKPNDIILLTYPGGSSSSRSSLRGFHEEPDTYYSQQVVGWALTTLEAKGYFLNLEHTPTQVAATVFKLMPDTQKGWLRLGTDTASYRSLFTAHQSRLKAVLEALTQTTRLEGTTIV